MQFCAKFLKKKEKSIINKNKSFSQPCQLLFIDARFREQS